MQNTTPLVGTTVTGGNGGSSYFRLWVKKDPGTSIPWTRVFNFTHLEFEKRINSPGWVKANILVGETDTTLRGILDASAFFVHVTDNNCPDGFAGQDVYGEAVADGTSSTVSIILAVNINQDKEHKTSTTFRVANNGPLVGTRTPTTQPLTQVYKIHAFDADYGMMKMDPTYPGGVIDATASVGAIADQILGGGGGTTVLPAGTRCRVGGPFGGSNAGFPSAVVHFKQDHLYRSLQQVANIGPNLTGYVPTTPGFEYVMPMIINARYAYSDWVTEAYLLDSMAPGFITPHDATNISLQRDVRWYKRNTSNKSQFVVVRSTYGGFDTPAAKDSSTPPLNSSFIGTIIPPWIQTLMHFAPWVQTSSTVQNMQKVFLGMRQGTIEGLVWYDLELNNPIVRSADASGAGLFLGSVYQILDEGNSTALFTGRLTRFHYEQAKGDLLTITIGWRGDEDFAVDNWTKGQDLARVYLS